MLNSKRTGAYKKLTKDQPSGDLVSVSILSSIIIQAIIQFMAQVNILLILLILISSLAFTCS